MYDRWCLLSTPIFRHNAQLEDLARPATVSSKLLLSPDDLIQAFNYEIQLLGGCPSDPLGESLNGKGPNLADLDPGFLGEFGAIEFQIERKAGLLWLACQGNGYDGAGALVENIVTKNQDGAQACLLMTFCRFKICPDNIAS